MRNVLKFIKSNKVLVPTAVTFMLTGLIIILSAVKETPEEIEASEDE